MITSFFKPKLKTITKKRLSTETTEAKASVLVADEDIDCNNNRNVGMNSFSHHDEDSSQQPRKRARALPDIAPKNGCNDDDDDDDNNKDDASFAMDQLLSFLHPDSGWKNELDKLSPAIFQSKSFAKLAKFVAQERQSHIIYPPPQHTWAALNLCPLHQVRVVILGQDPYHGPGQAHGLCFSVLPGQALPPSLKNIYQELQWDVDIANFTALPTHGHLTRWAQQGVLLLNTVLSVRKGMANSHQKQGWEQVTSAILKCLLGRKCVFLAWGKPAAQRLQDLHATPAARGQTKNHVVIATSHPSPLGARKTKAPFLGSRCFSRCNAALQKMGLEPIDWRVDGPLPENMPSTTLLD